MKTNKNIIITVLVIVLVILLARFVVFKDQFQKWGDGLDRIGAWQDSYKKDHPNATKEETDAAFNAGIANIEVWKANYKKDHPDATDAQADAAFNAAWNQQK